LIAAVSRPHPTRSTAKILCNGSPTSGFGLIRDTLPKAGATGQIIFHPVHQDFERAWNHSRHSFLQVARRCCAVLIMMAGKKP